METNKACKSALSAEIVEATKGEEETKRFVTNSAKGEAVIWGRAEGMVEAMHKICTAIASRNVQETDVEELRIDWRIWLRRGRIQRAYSLRVHLFPKCSLVIKFLIQTAASSAKTSSPPPMAPKICGVTAALRTFFSKSSREKSMDPRRARVWAFRSWELWM